METINVQQQVSAIIGLVDDTSKQPIAATFSGVSYSSDNTGVLTTEQNAENPEEQDITGVAAPGTANLLIAATAEYTDGNTNQPVSKTFNISVPVTVAEAAPEAEAVDLVVNFGTATVVTAAATGSQAAS